MFQAIMSNIIMHGNITKRFQEIKQKKRLLKIFLKILAMLSKTMIQSS